MPDNNHIKNTQDNNTGGKSRQHRHRSHNGHSHGHRGNSQQNQASANTRKTGQKDSNQQRQPKQNQQKQNSQKQGSQKQYGKKSSSVCYDPKETIYTRNSEPMSAGIKLQNISIYNEKEEEIDLHLLKKKKLYVTIPSLEDQAIMKEIALLDEKLTDIQEYQCFLISNEPVFTQTRLARNYKIKNFNLLSDYKNNNFARNTGTYIYEIGKLVKAVFIVDEDDLIIDVKYYDDNYSSIDTEELLKKLGKTDQ